MTNDFNRLKRSSKRFKEDNDCAVIALALCNDLPYAISHKLVAEHLGRKKRGTTFLRRFLKSFYWLNGVIPRSFPAQSFQLNDDVSISTPIGDIGRPYILYKKGGQLLMVKEITQYLPDKGRFLLFVRGHVAAYVDGVVHDWTADRRHRVKLVVHMHGSITLNNVSQEVISHD